MEQRRHVSGSIDIGSMPTNAPMPALFEKVVLKFDVIESVKVTSESAGRMALTACDFIVANSYKV